MLLLGMLALIARHAIYVLLVVLNCLLSLRLPEAIWLRLLTLCTAVAVHARQEAWRTYMLACAVPKGDGVVHIKSTPLLVTGLCLLWTRLCML